AAVKALRVLHPHCPNVFQLRYLDFIYLQTAMGLHWPLNEIPILEISWNDQELLQEMRSPSSACIILTLHNGFTHTARALSLSERKIAAVSRFLLLDTYQKNKVQNPHDIEIVFVNRHTLLKLTEIARQNKAIICTPDFPITGNFDYL